MTNEPDRSRLDTVIDDVVRDMMQAEARTDLAGRILRSIEEPPRRAWFAGAPALAAASAAILVLVAIAALFRGAEPVDVPSLQVDAGPPAALEAAPSVGAAGDLPQASTPATALAPVPDAESIFGPRQGQVSAASVRAPAQVRLTLVLSEATADSRARTQVLTMVLSSGEKSDGHAGAAGEPQLNVSVTPEVLSSGAIKATVAVTAPIQRQLIVTLVPGTPTQLFDTVEERSGRRLTLEATATLVNTGIPQR